MVERTRAHLRQEFQDGERPSGADFSDIFDSALNKQDDGIAIDPGDSTLVLSRGLRLCDSADATPGTLRFNGGVPQYHDGVGFVAIGGGGGGGAFQAVGGGADVAYTAGGTVGIGPFAAPPAYRFEVELAASAATTEQVRLGNTVMFRGTAAQAGSAHVAHRDHADNTDFALRQRQTGEVSLNAPPNTPIFLTQGGSTANSRLTVAAGGQVLVATPNTLTADAATVLHVGGNAIKNAGGNNWAVPSDARVKQDVNSYRAGLPEVCAIRPVSFRYNGRAGTQAGSPGIGVIGQEIEAILPETISTIRGQGTGPADAIDDMRIYDSGPLIYALVNAVQELTRRLEALETARLAQ